MQQPVSDCGCDSTLCACDRGAVTSLALPVCHHRPPVVMFQQRILDAAGIDTGDAASASAAVPSGGAAVTNAAGAVGGDAGAAAGAASGTAGGAPAPDVAAALSAVEFESVHVKDVPTLVLYLGNLNKVTTVEDVHEALAQVGVLASRVEVREKRTSTRVSYFAHVYFASPEDTERVSDLPTARRGDVWLQCAVADACVDPASVPRTGPQGAARCEHARQQGGRAVPRR